MKTEGRRVELSPRQSWDAVATLALDQGTGGATLTCSRIAFSLRTEKSTDSERAGLFTAIASRDGDAPYNYLAKIADSYELAEGDWVLPARGSCPNYELAVSSLVLSALDENQDGVADRLVGTGAAYERTIEPLSDVLYGIPIEVSAVPDVTPPSFVQRAPMHPLDFATSFVEASEILDVAGDVRLSTHPDVPLLQVMLDAQPYGAHFFAEFEVLPFGGSWTVSSTKTDLVGLAVEGAWSLSTIDDPGILLDGGFEGTNLPMVSSGLVRRSTSVLGVPAISGDYSLVMRSDASATFHLAREAGTSQLSVRVRAFGAASQTNGRGFRFEAGVIGAKNIGRFDVSESGGVNIGSPSWTEGSIVNVVIPLDDPGDDVVVRIAGDCAPPCTDFRAIQVDDLRVE